MAEAFKILGQANPLAATLTDTYTVPAATEVTVSSIIVANRSAVGVDFRISVAPGGAADSLEQYIYYDITIPAKDSFATTTGITLAPTDVVRVYAASASLSFTICGVEIT